MYAPRRSNASILIADDSEDLRKVLAWLLPPRGYDILEPVAASEAIQTAIATDSSFWIFAYPTRAGWTLRGQ
jgi:CheY-like chemotaxis protein